MHALQTHYTSSRKCRSGSAGFGFHACSDGVTPEDLREIEQLGEYQVSRDLDPHAPPDRIMRHFPILLRFRVLVSGHWALVRARYTGQDYSGRTGNFFAHGLIARTEDLRYWPVDYCEWEGWQDRLEDARDTDEIAPALPPLDLTTVAPAESFSLSGLQEFLKETPAAQDLLAAMIRAALLGKETSRPILIRETRSNGIYWAACIQKAFPRALAPHLSFNTYQYDGRGCEAINITVGETNLRLDADAMRFQFFAFDQLDGRRSEVPAVAEEYAETVAAWMVEDPDRLQGLHRFMENFRWQALSADVLHGLRLYQRSLDIIESPTSDVLRGMLDFATRSAKSEARGTLMEILVGGLDRLEESATPEDYSLLLRFLVETAAATGDGAHRERTLDTWLRLFDDLAVEQGVSGEVPEKTKALLLERLPDARIDLARCFFSDDHLDRLAPCLPRLDQSQALDLLNETLAQMAGLDETGDRGNWPDRPGAEFLTAIVTASQQPAPLISALLKTTAGNADSLTRACLRIVRSIHADSTDQETTGRHLETLGRCLGAEIAAGNLGADAHPLRTHFDAPKYHRVLAGEWLYRLEQARDLRALRALYKDYRTQDQPKLPAFDRAMGAWLESSYFMRLPDSKALVRARDWLQEDGLADLEAEALGRALRLLNRNIPLPTAGEEEYRDAQRLREIARKSNLVLDPDRGLILEVTRNHKGYKQSDWKKLAPVLIGQLGKLSGKEYRAVLDAILPHALADCKDYAHHGSIVVALVSADHRHSFLKAYRKALNDKRNKITSGIRTAVKYWLLIRQQGSPAGNEGDREIRDILTCAVASLSSKEREELERKMSGDKEIRGNVKKDWDALLKSSRWPSRLSSRLIRTAKGLVPTSPARK